MFSCGLAGRPRTPGDIRLFGLSYHGRYASGRRQLAGLRRVGFVKPCEIRTFSLVLIVSDLREIASGLYMDSR
jgi:hypothetical protein